MSSRSTVIAVVVVLIAALGFTGYLFVVQNIRRTTQLSLDLYFAAWQLSEPVPVIALVGIAFVLGFVIAAAAFGLRAAQLGRRLRRLEQEVALGGGATASGGGARGEWR